MPDNVTNTDPQWGFSKAFAARRAKGRIWCLCLILYSLVTLILSQIVGNSILLQEICPFTFTYQAIIFIAYYSELESIRLIHVLFYALAGLPLVGWFQLEKKKPIGVKLIRIPCMTLLVVTLFTVVFMVFTPFGPYMTAVYPAYLLPIIPGIGIPILILLTLDRWNPLA